MFPGSFQFDIFRQQRREMEISVNSAEPTLDSEMEQRLAAEQVKTRQVEKELAIEIQVGQEIVFWGDLEI